MNSASRASLEPDSGSDRSVESGIGCLCATERVVSVDRAARYLSNFGNELEKEKIQRQVTEDVGSRELLRERYRVGVRRPNRRHGSRGHVYVGIPRGIIGVLTDPGDQANQEEILAGDEAPGLGLQAEVVHIQRVAAA